MAKKKPAKRAPGGGRKPKGYTVQMTLRLQPDTEQIVAKVVEQLGVTRMDAVNHLIRQSDITH